MPAWLAALWLLIAAASAVAEDRLQVDVDQGAGRAYRVAVQHFERGPGVAPELEERFHQALISGLEYSGIAEAVSPRAFLGPLETRDYEDASFQCDDWRAIGADALLQGRIESADAGLRIRFRLFDSVRCLPLGKPHRYQSEAGPSDAGRIGYLARRLADEVVRRFTGQRGVSSTQIAFVSDRGGNKEVFIMGADGSAPTRVTGNGDINLFPSWSPDADSLAYTSYKSGRPDVWLLSRGARRNGPLLGSRDAKYRGVWAPRNGDLALVMSREGNTDIYLVGENGRGLRRVTRDRSIETSPTWSPDGLRLAYVSDRSGSPQLYVRDLASGKSRRLTFEGSYNASPAWSPTGEWIVYAARSGSNFDLYLIDPDSGYTRPLVSHPRQDEEPAWSPDGRKVAFVSSRRGRTDIYVVDVDGRNLRRLTADFGNSSNPAWASWLD